MYIIHSTADGQTFYHHLTALEVLPETVRVLVETSYSEVILDPTGNATPPFTQQFEAPLLAMSTDPYASVAEWTVSLDGPLTGGLAVTDAEFPFISKRLEMRKKIKALRDQNEQKGIPSPFGPIDTDVNSQRKIHGAVTMALVATITQQPFGRSWRMADDTRVTLNATQMIQMGVFIATHVDACQTRKNTLDDLIDEAETVEDLELIDVEEDWPPIAE